MSHFSTADFADPAMWPRDPGEARALQRRLAPRIVERDAFGPIRRIAGVDVHFGRGPGMGLAWAAVAVLDAESLELVESVQLCREVAFPYVPGLLSFREAPAVLAALALLREPPDLLMVDGQGRAHPRRLGIASHVGYLADLPTIGVAKSRLVGRHAEPARERGASVPLEHKGEIIGAVLRTQDGRQPLYVSVGHRVGLDSAVRLTLAATTRYRLPQPTRLADQLSRMHR